MERVLKTYRNLFSIPESVRWRVTCSSAARVIKLYGESGIIRIKTITHVFEIRANNSTSTNYSKHRTIRSQWNNTFLVIRISVEILVVWIVVLIMSCIKKSCVQVVMEEDGH